MCSGVLPIFKSFHCEQIGEHAIFLTFSIKTFARGEDGCPWHLIPIPPVNPGQLAQWETKTQVSIYCPRKLLVTMPIVGFPAHQLHKYGCNPTGMTATLERRKRVLELAREHNFLILEGRIPQFRFMLCAALHTSNFR